MNDSTSCQISKETHKKISKVIKSFQACTGIKPVRYHIHEILMNLGIQHWDYTPKIIYQSKDNIDPMFTLEEMTNTHIKAVLKACGGNRHTSAKVLGIGERTLYRKLKEIGVKQSVFCSE